MKSRRGKRRFKIRHLLVIILIVFLVITLGKQQAKINEIKRKQAIVEKDIREALLQQEKLKEQIKLLNTDEYIEKIAREELGLIKPGEIIYKIGSKESEMKHEF